MSGGESKGWGWRWHCFGFSGRCGGGGHRICMDEIELLALDLAGQLGLIPLVGFCGIVSFRRCNERIATLCKMV